MRIKLLLTTAVLAAGAWFLWPSSPSEQPDQDTLFNRIWIDRLPEAPTDKFNVFVILEDPEAGVFQNTSFYEGDYSMFAWEDHDGDHMDIIMLQTQKRHKVHFAVASRGCRGFDYCMRLGGAPRGAKRYYSMEDWVIEVGDAPARVDPATLQRLIAARRESHRNGRE